MPARTNKARKYDVFRLLRISAIRYEETYFFTKIIEFKKSRTSFNLCLNHGGRGDLPKEKKINKKKGGIMT